MRNRYMAFGLAALMAAFGPVAAAKEKLVVWNWNRPEVAAELQPVFDRFAKAHNVDIEVQIVAWGDMKDKLVLAIAAGMAPDVTAVSSNWFDDLARQGAFADLTPYMKADSTALTADIFPASMQAWQGDDGKQYGFPFDNDISVLISNVDLFNDVGVPHPDETWTWKEWLEAGMKHSRDVNGDGKKDFYGMTNWWWGSWWSLVWANNGELFGRDRRPALKTEAAREAFNWYAEWFGPRRGALAMWDELAHLGYDPSQQKYPSNAFIEGRIAMVPAGVWAVDAFLVDSKTGRYRFNFGITSLPQSPKGGRATAIEGQGNAVLATSKHQALAYRLVKTLAEAEAQRVGAKAGQFPVTKSVALSDAFLPQWSRANKNATINAVAWARPLPKGVAFAQTRDILTRSLTQFFTGRRGLEDVLEEATTQIEARLQSIGAIK